METQVDIVNMSLGGRGMSDDVKLKLEDVIHRFNAIGVSVVVAAGNTGKDLENYYPANFDDVITVGAVDQHKLHAYFFKHRKQR